jgi:hypothetical protein
MLKPNQTVRPIVTKPKTTRSEPAADKLPVFGVGLEGLDCVSGGLTPMGPAARDPRSTQPAAAGVAASIGISNFGLALRRA